MNFIDKKGSLFGDILPSCALFNGVNDYINIGNPAILNIGTSDFYFAARVFTNTNPASLVGIAGCDVNGGSTSIRFGFGMSNLCVPFSHLTFGAALNIDANATFNIKGRECVEMVMNVDRDGLAHFYVDGVIIWEQDISAQAAFDFIPSNSFRIGCHGHWLGTPTLYFPGSIQLVSFGKRLLTPLEITNLDKIVDGVNTMTFYPQGDGDYEYDVSGNGIEGAWSGSGTRKTYFKFGYPHPIINGYSKYIKAGSPDIQIPNTKAGVAIVAPTVPAGYAFDEFVAGSNVYINSGNCLIDFDPLDREASAVEIFNRSNITIHNAISRASAYYNASYPYRWHISELIDYATYNSYFNASYKDRLFVRKAGNEVREILNYATKKTGDQLLTVKYYCGI